MTEPLFRIQTIGPFEVRGVDGVVPLPPSRKSKALLAYLSLAERKHSRQSLCELFWDNTADPLASLRWSLTKLRRVLKADGAMIIHADRETVWLDKSRIKIDKDCLNLVANEGIVTEEHADQVWKATIGLPLEGCELPNQRDFMLWVEAYRQDYARLRAGIAKRFARDRQLSWQTRDKWAERWLRFSPYSIGAAVTAYQNKFFAAGRPAAQGFAKKITKSFSEAGIQPPDFVIDESAVEDNPRASPVAPVEQQIHFVQGVDGVNIAWASVGDPDNPPLVKAANWLNHLELDWDAPIWSPLFKELSQSHRLLRYDERGCGLSDWDVGDISFDSFVKDLEQVVDAAGLDRFPLLGISQGAAVSVRYAVLHPDRVSHLILFGGYDRGWRHSATAKEVLEREAVMVLTKAGWGMDNPAYRHVFSRTFMPNANAEELDWFDEFQRLTTSSDNAVRFLEAFSTIDVRDDLAKVRCPTLVVHSRDDLRIPFATGRTLAASIPGAQLAGLDSKNHLLLGRERASTQFVQLVREFLAKD